MPSRVIFRSTYLVLALATVLGGGVASADLPIGDTTNLTLPFQSLTRRYDVHVPPSYAPGTPTPVVLDMHGYTVDGQVQAAISGLKALSDSAGFIVAWPWGYDGGNPSERSWNAGTCCPPATTAGIDDVGFLRALVADLSQRVAVDPARIYATGISNGGAMSHRLACEAGDLFAAVVSVAAPLILDPFTTCVPSRPMPVLHFAGLTDIVVPYDGGQSQVFPAFFFPSSPASFAYWAHTDGCTGGTTIETLPNGGACETYATCDGGAVTGLCSMHGTDGAPLYGHVLYFNSDGLSIAQRTWSFLSPFTLPGGGTVTVLGKSFVVKDPLPGGDPSRRSVVVLGKESASAQTIVGNPLASGATVEIVANGATSSAQTFVLPAGASVGGSAGWKALGNPVIGYSYKDALGAVGPVKSALLKKAGGTLVAKVTLKGLLGPGPQPHVTVLPPAPGTDGGMRVTITGGTSYCVAFGGAAGGAIVNAPTSGTANKVFKVTSRPTTPTVEAGCPIP